MKVKCVKLTTAFPDGLEVGNIYEVVEHCDTGYFVKCENQEGRAFIYTKESEIIQE